ncbi:unnamed protein product [Durusdinium trenchii]|uniref:Uncharacterized protein n=2 Tax=Durusdinium trenchii TaxID=1381693 RepID=A0ABP0IS07_9DINO
MSNSSCHLVRAAQKRRNLTGWLLPCCLVLFSCCDFAHRNYVGGTLQRRLRNDRMQTILPRLVRERRATTPRSPDAPKLTSRIYEAKSAEDLMVVLEEAAGAPYLNYFHASAAYVTLAKFYQAGLLPDECAQSPAIMKFQSQVLTMIGKGRFNAQASANVLRSVAILFGAMPSVIQLLPALAKVLPLIVRDMTEQELSNGLWASEKLKDVAPDQVAKIVGALANQVAVKSESMIPQALSNSLWSLGQLMELVPDDVRKMAPALAAHIPDKADKMKPQELANSLWALVVLQGVLQDVGTIQLMMKQVMRLTPSVDSRERGLSLPIVAWACAKLGLEDDELLSQVQRLMSAGSQLSSVPDWGVCALAWSYQILDQTQQFGEFQGAVAAEVAKRGLSEADVERSQKGYAEW